MMEAGQRGQVGIHNSAGFASKLAGHRIVEGVIVVVDVLLVVFDCVWGVSARDKRAREHDVACRHDERGAGGLDDRRAVLVHLPSAEVIARQRCVGSNCHCCTGQVCLHLGKNCGTCGCGAGVSVGYSMFFCRVVGAKHQAAIASDRAGQHRARNRIVELVALEGTLGNRYFRVGSRILDRFDDGGLSGVRAVRVLQIALDLIRDIAVGSEGAGEGNVNARHRERVSGNCRIRRGPAAERVARGYCGILSDVHRGPMSVGCSTRYDTGALGHCALERIAHGIHRAVVVDLEHEAAVASDGPQLNGLAAHVHMREASRAVILGLCGDLNTRRASQIVSVGQRVAVVVGVLLVMLDSVGGVGVRGEGTGEHHVGSRHRNHAVDNRSAVWRGD